MEKLKPLPARSSVCLLYSVEQGGCLTTYSRTMGVGLMYTPGSRREVQLILVGELSVGDKPERERKKKKPKLLGTCPECTVSVWTHILGSFATPLGLRHSSSDLGHAYIKQCTFSQDLIHYSQPYNEWFRRPGYIQLKAIGGRSKVPKRQRLETLGHSFKLSIIHTTVEWCW